MTMILKHPVCHAQWQSGSVVNTITPLLMKYSDTQMKIKKGRDIW
jgi:hypothetical protein